MQIYEKFEMKPYAVRVDGATAETQIEFIAAQAKPANRWFLDNILIVPAK